MSITLRDIREDDLEMIMCWRMDPDITRYMNTDPQLTLANQKKWLKFLKNNNCVMYWIVEIDEIPVGLINLAGIDWEKKESSWGYYIAKKNFRSLNLAISLEMSLYDYVFDVLKFEVLHNEVFSLNAGVIKLHLACGSHITEEIKGAIEKAGVVYDITHMSITKDEWNQIRWIKKYERVNFDISISRLL